MPKLTNFLVVIAALAILIGCGSSPEETGTDEADSDTSTSESVPHSHGEGPHGGVVSDWGGGKYHVEFTVNHETKEATVYLLDGSAKSAAPIKTDSLLLTFTDPTFQVDLAAAPLEGESDGLCSRFTGNHESLGVVQEFAGTISGVIEGTPFAGDFEETAHDH